MRLSPISIEIRVEKRAINPGDFEKISENFSGGAGPRLNGKGRLVGKADRNLTQRHGGTERIKSARAQRRELLAARVDGY